MRTLLSVQGTNADEMFEDIGHSNEARRKMKQFLVAPVDVPNVLFAIFPVIDRC